MNLAGLKDILASYGYPADVLDKLEADTPGKLPHSLCKPYRGPRQ